MAEQVFQLKSVGVYCGSSNAADPRYLAAAGRFGALLAQGGIRLVYGGGGVGLMGACARAAHEAGGSVLGVMPAFLQSAEILYEAVETMVVQTMHQRKQIMFEAADGFAVFPGGVGTLEEVVELMSWRRLGLHAKPIVFYNPARFWAPLFALIEQTVEARLTPASFTATYAQVETVEEILPRLAALGGGTTAPPSMAPGLI